ncbi:MAG TPA: 4Fe-4S dicluster domain-containing protein [Caulobacteraceae bacterium]|nr:4Fe-4S dicluster domain-containing protein [Caulobacteraceae bacterium]
MSGRPDIDVSRLTGRTGRQFWRTLREHANLDEAIETEFAAAFEGLSDRGRRELLKVMGASLALLGVAGCSQQGDVRALPYVTQPESETPDRPKHYATAVIMAGWAQPVVGTTHVGRPTKLEGNPNHPASGGATDAFTQAAILGLYDPNRSQGPRFQGRPAAWSAFDDAMVENAARLNARQGEGFRILTGASTSPTLARQLTEMMQRWPKAHWHVFEPFDDGLRLEASRLAFGRPLERRLNLDRAEVIVSLDDDLLGPGPRQTLNARQWSVRRRAFQAGQGQARLYVAEPTPSLIGAMASDRLIAAHSRIPVLTQALALALGDGGATVTLTAREQQWVERAARDLKAATGKALVSVGAQHAPEVQALGVALNSRIGALGHTIGFAEPSTLTPPDGAQSLSALVRDLDAGAVDTLLILDANPVFMAPADFAFARAMEKARLRVHAGLHYDETASHSHWHAPIQHALESWTDVRAVEGTASIVQPLVRPFYDVRSAHGLLEDAQGRLGQIDHELVQATWRAAWGGSFDESWRRALLDGLVANSASPEVAVSVGNVATPAPTASPTGVEILFRPDPSLWDGRFANNPWLQELPKPLNKITWDNVIAISPALARELNLESGIDHGDMVRIDAAGRSIEGPVWITPGQAANSVTVFTGYGRTLPGQLGDGHGFNAYPLRTSTAPFVITGAKLTRIGGRRLLACTQDHTALRGFDFVRTVPAAQARRERLEPPIHEPSLYPDVRYKGPSWGMSVDTDVCIGCNACVTGCDAENNVPMVGKDQVAKGRQMHWLRIDHYFEGEPEEPKLYFQPVPCMHCEKAPCEMGCPVGATVHSPDGLNLQVYNRCIGTRTCSSYCPYKVRRFNWFDFTGKDSPELQAARNPDVTVRSRGVMEKCTYCIQRIRETSITAELEGRPVKDGEIRTACQQACPTNAIVFGDVMNPESEVSRRKRSARDYTLLEEVNTRPRTTYLARIDDEEGG